MIRTRFSPSPTGMLHLGNVRAALFSELFATREKGVFLLRIEDTDQVRSDVAFADMLQDDLHWLGLEWQEGPDVGGSYAPYWQSKRHEIYAKYYEQLESQGEVYPCFCSDQELLLNRKLQLSRGQAPRYPGTCSHLSKEEVAKRIAENKKPALRFRVPMKTNIEFVDLVKGQQHFNSDDIGDFIIRRADGTASFLYCNAIDDSLMGVTHVIRGEDHLSNTPRQLMILKTLNMRTPQYGHLSLIMGDDGSKLSKRHGSFSLQDLRQQTYLPAAIMNYLARLSHTYEEQNLMTHAALAEHFHLEKASRAAARFDRNQLMHWQKEAVLALSDDAFWTWLGPELQQAVPAAQQNLFLTVMRQNILFCEEAKHWSRILFNGPLSFSESQQTILKEAGMDFYQAAKQSVETHQTNLPAILQELKTHLGISGKRLFMPLRIALTGEEHGPELAQIAILLGPEKILQRLQEAFA